VVITRAIEVGGDTDTVASSRGRLQELLLVFLPTMRDISPDSPEAMKSSQLQNVSRIFSVHVT
jgi:ADP-ribosylglycohydrolase